MILKIGIILILFLVFLLSVPEAQISAGASREKAEPMSARRAGRELRLDSCGRP
jgi:hypothetical protein